MLLFLQLALVTVQSAATAAPAGAVTPTSADNVYPRGTAGFFGSPGSSLTMPIVGMAATPSGNGYWLADKAGKVYHYGDAAAYGDLSAVGSGDPIVGFAARPDGTGYWLLQSSGGIFAFGAAGYFGSAYYSPDAVAIVSTPSGNGYWILKSSGAVANYGDAFHKGDLPGGAPFVSLARTATGNGYWLLARNGEVTPFGDAVDLGDGVSTGKTFSAILARPASDGYWLVATDGTLVNKGVAGAFTKAPGTIPVVTGAAAPNGTGLWVANSGVPLPGAISGTVKDTHGTALKGICVSAKDADAGVPSEVQTSSTGFYKIKNLRPGSYTVAFNDCTNAVYFPQWYNGVTSEAAATPVAVTTNKTTPSINASLAAGASISGAVTDTNGNPTASCIMAKDRATGETAYTTNFGEYGWISGYVGPGRLYRIGPLNPGNYTVAFTDCGADTNLTQFYPGSQFESGAQPVALSEGTAAKDINGYIAPSGSITGRVTDAAGQPLPYTCVRATLPGAQYRAAEGNFIAYGFTDVSGFYRIGGLQSSSYVVQFDDCGYSDGGLVKEYYPDAATEDQATPVAVVAGANTPAVDVQLSSGATISGHVTQPTDSFGVCVKAYQGDSNNVLAQAYVQWWNGSYTLTGLRGGSYLLHFDNCWGQGAAPEWYDNSGTRAGATPVTVADNGQVTGVDATLGSPGAITGVVKAPDGSVLPGACVTTMDDDGIGDFTYTSSTGFYRMSGLGTQGYKVRFDPCGTVDGAFEWYTNKASESTANVVNVTAGTTTGNINAQFDTPGAIAGVVTQSDGQFAAGLCVELHESTASPSRDAFASGFTSITGYYRVGGLHAGGYKVRFIECDPGNRTEEWFNNKLDRGTANTATVAAGATTTVNASVTLATPDAPTGVTATVANTRSHVSWTAPANQGTSAVTTYDVTAWTNNRFLRTVTVATPSTFVDFTGLTDGVPYRFTVAARNATGAGPLSSPSNVVTPLLNTSIGAPTGLDQPVRIGFNDDVRGLNTTNIVLRDASNNIVTATLTCRSSTGAAVNCTTGPVRTARLLPTSPLVDGAQYTAYVNPAGVAPVRDFAGNVARPRTLTFTASSAVVAASSGNKV